MTIEENKNKINATKKAMRITLGEIASKSGLSEAWICRYLRGKHDNPTHKTTQRLDEAIASIVEQRRKQFMSNDGEEDTIDPVGSVGHTHDGTDRLVPSESPVEARAEDPASSDNGPVSGPSSGEGA